MTSYLAVGTLCLALGLFLGYLDGQLRIKNLPTWTETHKAYLLGHSRSMCCLSKMCKEELIDCILENRKKPHP